MIINLKRRKEISKILIKKQENLLTIYKQKGSTIPKLYDWFCILSYVGIMYINKKYLMSNLFIDINLCILFWLSITSNIGVKKFKKVSKTETKRIFNDFLKD